MTRHEEREQAFILLFEQSFCRQEMETIIENAEEARELEAGDFTRALAFGTQEHMDEIDEMIRESIRGWSLNRLSKVALAVMRLCVYELHYEQDIPSSVSINEAVELAKLYGTKQDAPYINGVLSSIEKKRVGSAVEENGKDGAQQIESATKAGEND